ncbi:MAG: bifunctional histidinol-phosphatase/imidazoleglycerol-phosphate dehydratase HisB [Schleiferiaceae bacterium]|nr:bifunctional histidinol-phosphatase/imidazoleglycerol-phosphate dehydratase HisB [Schleiferiaceae bacterium]
MKKKALFIDRDGTLIVEPKVDQQVDSLDKLEFLPGVFRYLGNIAAELDYELVMVTNQDGLGTPSFPEDTFWPAQRKLLRCFENEGIQFYDIHIDNTFAHQNAPTRKPGTGLLPAYIYGPWDLENSFVIGDRETDVQLADNLGCKSIFLNAQPLAKATYHAATWRDIYSYLKNLPRNAATIRTTKETDIQATIFLDGEGVDEIETGLPFFDHMLQQLCTHGGIDLTIKAKGDLEVDEHHLIEDVAIVLGQTIKAALGKKKGIQRYGFFLPMDDCQARVLLDLGGRYDFKWKANFRREKIGDMPTEMFAHFFNSFANAAACNLHITAKGNNEHHKVEAIFKAFARALRMAIAQTTTTSIPSSKGTL